MIKLQIELMEAAGSKICFCSLFRSISGNIVCNEADSGTTSLSTSRAVSTKDIVLHPPLTNEHVISVTEVYTALWRR